MVTAPCLPSRGQYFIVNSDTHLPTQGWPPALPKRGRDDTPYITTYPIPAYNYRLSGCADQLRISSGYLRIPCPAHGGTNSNLALWVNQGGIAARCHSAGCSYADIAKAIEDRYGISINPRRYHDNPTALAPRPTNARRTPGPGPNAQDLRPHAINLWRRSVPIPKSSEHPARQWLANRNLWRPELPLPGPVRWISAEHLHHDYPGAGSIITMAAQPTSWTQAWPNLPELSCIHLVFVAGDGSPAMDRG